MKNGPIIKTIIKIPESTLLFEKVNNYINKLYFTNKLKYMPKNWEVTNLLKLKDYNKIKKEIDLLWKKN